MGVAACVRVLALAAVVLSTACSNGSGKSFTIEVLDGTFSPDRLHVPVGATVGWSWNGTREHQVRFSDSEESDVQLIGGFAKTFDAPGTYRYECGVHASMVGLVMVE